MSLVSIGSPGVPRVQSQPRPFHLPAAGWSPPWLWLVLVLVLLRPVASAQNPAPRTISAHGLQQIAAIEQEKASWTATQRKMSGDLILAAKRSTNKPMAPGMPSLPSSAMVDEQGTILVDIEADVSDALLGRIQALGGSVVSSFPRYGAIRARIPIAQMEALAGEATIRSIGPAAIPVCSKVNTSQGDVALQANLARLTYGVDGSGVKVGVLSDSVDNLATVQASGDLPTTVTVLPGQSGTPAGGEGTAMLEIIYDLAPGASLYFATANGGVAAMANNILALKNAGCQIIVDDVSYATEAAFKDGIIAQAVEQVCAAGVLYFSSAGNNGSLDHGSFGVWEGDFKPGLVSGNLILHDFGGGACANEIMSTTSSSYSLQWSDLPGGSANDYDLYMLDPTGYYVLVYSANPQTGTQNPWEQFLCAAGSDAVTCLLVIAKHAGAADRYLRLAADGQAVGAGDRLLAFGTAGRTFGHNAAASAFTVAAVDVATAYGHAFTGGAANPVEYFSSDGPRRMFFNADGSAITPGNFSSTGGAVRIKPDIAAADDVATYQAHFNPFKGTSAAAPHVAAIAALLLNYNPYVTPAQVRTAFTSTALDIEAWGVDRDSGFGIVNAWAAIGSVGRPGVLSVTPTAGLTSTGYVGGPFSPTGTSYTLSNMGGQPLNWTVSKTQSWVGLSKASGTLAAGGSDTVTVSIGSGANGLAAGLYSDTVTFANTTNHAGDTTRAVSLRVKIVGDIDGDGHVNAADLLPLAGSWGSRTGGANYSAACDLNGDGKVNVVDLLLLADNWGK